ncbi:hypothetical protein YC2023_081486 [Brassica napus]
MEGSPYKKFSISRGKGAVLGTGPGIIRSGEPGFLLAGILGTGVPSSGDPEAGVLPGVWMNSIPEYFFPNSLPLIARFRHRTWGIAYSLKSTGVAHSQQASLRQDIAPVVLRSRFHSGWNRTLNPGEDQFPLYQTWVWCYLDP